MSDEKPVVVPTKDEGDAISVVLRAGDPGFDVDAFLKKFPKLQPDAVWRKGERRWKHSKKIPASSGFNKWLCGGDSWEGVKEDLLALLEKRPRLLTTLQELGVGMELDIGLFVPTPTHFTKGIALSPPELKRLMSYGLTLIVTAYPCSYEEDEREDASEDPERDERD